MELQPRSDLLPYFRAGRMSCGLELCRREGGEAVQEEDGREGEECA